MSKKQNVADETDDALDDILNQAWDELPEEKILPGGDWLLKSKNAAFIKSKDADKSDKVLFFVTAVEPGESVDEERLAELGDYDVSISALNAQVYIEKPSDWKKKIVPILEAFGVEMEGKTIGQALKAFKNGRAMGTLTEETYEDKQTHETVPVNRVLPKFSKIED